MSEFGHTGVIGSGFCLDTWGHKELFMRLAGEKTVIFTDSDMFGPLFLTERGSPLKNQNIPEKTQFWRAHHYWIRQGRRVAEDGCTCVWDNPPPPKPHYFRKIGRQNVIVQTGDDDGYDPTPFIELMPGEVPPI